MREKVSVPDYLVNAKRMIADAEKKSAEYSGKCGDCKWSRGRFIMRCTNPVVRLAGFNAEQGYDRERIMECDEQRSKESPFGTVVCGPNGALWQPGFWASLFGGAK